MSDNTCIFCKIIQKQIPSKIIAETEDIIVIEDIRPKAPVHYLIIPKVHVSDIQSFTADQHTLAGNMLFMAQKLSQQLSGSKAFRLQVNNGAEAGQVVFHLHMHFLSGKRMLD